MLENFEIKAAEDLTIRGTVFYGSDEQIEKKPVIILAHGFKGFKNWGFFPYTAQQFTKHGFIAITFNFSMNGVGEDLLSFTEMDKFSENTYHREIEDLNEIVSAIEDDTLPYAELMDKESLYLLGHSKGGATVLLYTRENEEKINGVATWNAISQADLFHEELKKEIRENGTGYIYNGRTKEYMPVKQKAVEDVESNHERYDIIQAVQETETAKLFIQGGEDAPKLTAGAKELNKNAENGRLEWIETGSHTFNTAHPFEQSSPELEKAISSTVNFFKVQEKMKEKEKDGKEKE
ncbi:alpha/beta hydrolase family protein [Bacillus sp. FJAT-44742]|uniref:alpha/beta hydrolase family protein n=1 Tax=Bacillus sp. FJAT-44742 TaxID=2014005 RepID=UPI000C23D7F2|nr:alpha/beta fold hydrolase [Bacillus sp. FJAT-44742]